MAEEAKSETQTTSNWTYLSGAIWVSVLMLCMFVFQHVQDMRSRLEAMEDKVEAIIKTTEDNQKHLLHMSTDSLDSTKPSE
jgi:hypothetical protein